MDDPIGSIEQGITVGNSPIPVIYPGQVSQPGQKVGHTVFVKYGGKCKFETTLGTLKDSVMWLYRDNRENGTTELITSDDNSGAGDASLIQQTLPAGFYWVEVGAHYSTNGIGNYNLHISCLDPVFLHQKFSADSDASQCNGLAYGTMSAVLGNWTPAIRIDTDGRWGGCLQQFGVTDPASIASGLQLAVDFYGDGDLGQCSNPGPRAIPTTTSTTPQWSSSYRIDSDSRVGGCWQVFSLTGRSDMALDIEFVDEFSTGQCTNAGTHTVTASSSVALGINTDDRNGGCRQRFRLRRL